jgi:hypothetical protein
MREGDDKTSGSTTGGRGSRWIYVTLDVLFAAAYVWISLTIAKTTDGSFEVASIVFAICALAMAVGAAVPQAWAWWVGVIGCGLLLVGATVLLVLLASSAAYLSGVFGALGKGAAVIALVAAALVVEVYALLPLFQLRWLLARRA